MKPRSVTVVPIGEVRRDLLLWVRSALADALDIAVTLEDPLALSSAWYDRERDQYHGTAVLRALERVPRQERERVLGIADVDCYVAGLNFIFGQAAPCSGVAFVALPRLRQSFYRLPGDTELFRQRVRKEAVHELGHTLGLGDCAYPRCVMHFSNALADTDAKAATFCESCERGLSDR